MNAEILHDIGIRNEYAPLAASEDTSKTCPFTATLLVVKTTVLIDKSTHIQDTIHLEKQKERFIDNARRAITVALSTGKPVHHLILTQYEWICDLLGIESTWLEKRIRGAKTRATGGPLTYFKGGQIKNLGIKGYKLQPNNEALDYIVPKRI